MAERSPSPLPPDVIQALADAELLDTFRALPPSHQEEYLRWIEEAKREDTRRRRIEGTLARLAPT